MKKLFFLLAVFCTLIATAQQKNTKLEEAIKVANQVKENLLNGNYEGLTQLFDSRLKENLQARKIEKLFEQFKKEHGEIKETLPLKEKVLAEGTRYHQGLVFDNSTFDIVFGLTEENKMSGFRMAPHWEVHSWNKPNYISIDNSKSTAIKIGEELPLFGEFVEPQQEAYNTIVVMVHGSGPNDMDESLGPNKLFKDLAYGLAEKGIASIRYNKRSYDYPATLAKQATKLTFDDVVTNDAILAIKRAKEMGAQKVVLLGHSLGGHLAPRIAEQEKVNGVIVMAGNSSRLEELLVSQYEHIMKNDSTSGITEFQLNMVRSQVKNVKDKNYTASTVGPTLPLGLAGTFWLNLADYEPVKIAKKQAQPYLILNGERDYQVTEAEAKRWKNGNKNKKSKTIVYPKLNHMFFAGEGVLIPSEYERKASLEEVVLNDISNWIKAL